jgi:hypothetical protein
MISRARTRNPILTWASGTAPVIVRVGALWHTGKAWAILDAHQQLPQAHPPVVNRRT